MRRLLILGLVLGFCLGGLGCNKEQPGPTSFPPPSGRLQRPGAGNGGPGEPPP
jgi:hypothetical protein